MKTLFYTAALASALAFVPVSAVSAAIPLSGFTAGSTIAPLSRASLAAPLEAGFDISGVTSWDELGSAFNFVGFAPLGANSRIVGIGWDVNLTTTGFSWLSEAVMLFSNLDQSAGVNLTVGFGDSFSGSAGYSSGGIVDLVALDLDFALGADGNLRVEFFESFDDNFAGIDATYDGPSTIFIRWIPVPEPATWAMMIAGFGMVGAATRRRRTAVMQA